VQREDLARREVVHRAVDGEATDGASGKNIGRTTNESVEKAMRASTMPSTAESPSAAAAASAWLGHERTTQSDPRTERPPDNPVAGG